MKPPPTSPSHLRRLCNYLQQKYESIPKTRRHIMLAVTCLFWFLVVGVVSGVASLRHGPDNRELNIQSPKWANPTLTGNLSTSMALSIISRQQGIMKDKTEPGAALQAGVVQKALTAHNAYHGAHPEIQAYIDNSTASAARLMTSEAEDLRNWPLDRLSTGNAMLSGDDKSNDPTVAAALQSLRNTVHLNNVNAESGLWYWDNYPHWSYLDGMYSLAPFVALDYRRGTAGDDDTAANNGDNNNNHNATRAFADKVVLQFDLLWKHCYNETTGLLVHGYDAGLEATWAAKVTGASGVVWGRSLGWFMMALVDTIEIIWPDYWHGGIDTTPDPLEPYLRDLLGMYRSLASAVRMHADDASGGWFQVVDMPRREGNYVESSATAMFAYALLKGARLGYLSPGDDMDLAVNAGLAAHALLVREFVTTNDEEEGVLSWGGTVGVCSLNSTATYDYYVGQPIVPDSVLGAAAFVLASVEVERLGDAAGTTKR